MSHRLPQTIVEPTLLTAAVLAVLVVNTEAVHAVYDVSAHDLQVRLGPIHVRQAVARWATEGLLTMVWFVTGRTATREFAAGMVGVRSLAYLAVAGMAAVGFGGYVHAGSVEFAALAVAGVILAAMTVFRVSGMWWMPALVLAGAGLWLAVFAAGVNAALVGVVCGLLYPAVGHRVENITVGAGSAATVGYRKLAALPGG